MYLAPFVAMALYWHAHRGVGDASGWSTLQAAAVGRSAYARPVAGALLFAAVVVTGAVGVRGGVAFVAGAALTVFAAALVYSASAAAMENAKENPESGAAARIWSDACAIALAPAALATGCVGALAWFFADPSGAVVLAAFAAGSSAGALLLGMTLSVTGPVPETVTADAGAAATRSTLASSATAVMHSHLPAIAASLMVASTAEPETLLSLGGLLAETETLRSELLLLPIAVSILSPLLALLVGPLFSSLLERRRETSLFDVERLAAALACLAVLALVLASGLAWVVAAAFVTGVVARQLALVADESSVRSVPAGRHESPSLLPALVSVAALACGEQLAGWYGMTLVALGMTATFASAAACATARDLATTTSMTRAELGAADATVSLTTTLALLVAMAPVLVADVAHRGAALTLMATASPALLLGAVVGAAAAATLSERYAESDNEGDAVSKASQAVVVAAGAPALAGILLGAGAAVGVVLGFVAWAAAAAPLAGARSDGSPSRDRMPRSLMLAWGRTMAIAALVGIPIMR